MFKGEITYERILGRPDVDSPNIDVKSSFSEFQNTTNNGPEVSSKKDAATLNTVTIVCLLTSIIIFFLSIMNFIFTWFQSSKLRIKTKSK